MTVHYTESYLLNPPHKVTVDLIGLGGTGSQVLTNLGRMNAALIALGHPGLQVRCWDDDYVTDANVGRQLFSPADIGINKAIVLATRINKFYGTEWQAIPEQFSHKHGLSNITVTCVDTAADRLEIYETLRVQVNGEPTSTNYYWLDLGNMQHTGQVILGTLRNIKQPKSEQVTNGALPTVVKKFPELKKIKEKNQGPSCSVAEALLKQDLFINSIMAQFGVNMLWKLFREGMISYHGCYVNLATLSVNPIRF